MYYPDTAGKQIYPGSIEMVKKSKQKVKIMWLARATFSHFPDSPITMTQKPETY